MVERMLLEAANIKRLADQFSQKDEGRLTIATTHTQARYALPQVVSRFKQDFPRVHLVLLQGGPGEIVDLLNSGEADVGIATEALEGVQSLASFPYYSWHHTVIVPVGHPLLERQEPLTLEAIAEHPIITYHEGFTGRASIDQTFAQAGLAPDIVMAALDADVIKTYIELGLGIGIIASMAYNPERDHNLRLIASEHLFKANTTRIAVRKGHYLRGYAYRFIEHCAPVLTEVVVKNALAPAKGLEIE
jgi:LysR family cys regulon transcriptional activator